MSTMRGRIIECLRDAGRPLDYVAVAGRIGRTIYYTKTVFAQLFQGEYIRKVGTTPGVRSPRATYRPTSKGLAVLAPDYEPQKTGAATRKANRDATQPVAPKPAPKRPQRDLRLWDVWR